MSTAKKLEFLRTLFGFGEVANRWGLSVDSVRRAADRGDLKTVNIQGRRMVPLTEIQRAEQYGIGMGRKRRQPESGLVVEAR
jgi:hypothetical protein